MMRSRARDDGARSFHPMRVDPPLHHRVCVMMVEGPPFGMVEAQSASRTTELLLHDRYHLLRPRMIAPRQVLTQKVLAEP